MPILRPTASPEDAMQSQNRIFDDLAKVAGGALSALGGLKQEMETLVRDRLERFMAEGNFVRREEFDAVQAMAAAARTEQEQLNKRVELEQAIERLTKARSS
jgi:BMFP domain-containing protein YqiC